MANRVSQTEKSSHIGLVLTVAGVVAFAIMGDSLLYGILPLAASDLSLLPQQVGLLLSANRLIRLLSNTWLGLLFARFGPERTFVVSAILGVLTTFTYGLSWGFVVFLLARMAWGISWSGLRQGAYQAIWAGTGSAAGRLMGLTMGVVRGGSAIGVLLGGFLFDRYGYQTTVLTIAALSSLAIPLALWLSWPENAEPGQPVTRSTPSAGTVVRSWREALSDPLQRTVLAMGFFKLILNSVLVATASLFLAAGFAEEGNGIIFGLGVGALAGMVLATRWFSDLFLGTVFGTLADRFGRLRLAVLLILLLCSGLALMLWGSGLLSILALLGVLICSTGVNIILDAYANQLALRTVQPELFVGAYTTTSDIGSALGPLLAFPLLNIVGFTPLYSIAAFLTLLAIILLAFQEKGREFKGERDSQLMRDG